MEILREYSSRGITRLCHFTPSRCLAHIVAGKNGVLATSHLEADERLVLNPTDLKRYDGYTGHISCSVEYPNAWYLSKAKENEKIFNDWVVLLIDPHYLQRSDTLFCPRNAAAGCGRYVKSGIEAFRSLYGENVVGAGSRTYHRSTSHLSACPTDNQAEVMIADCINLADISGVVVRDEMQAKNEIKRLELQELTFNANFVIAPTLFNKTSLSNSISRGTRPVELIYEAEGSHVK